MSTWAAAFLAAGVAGTIFYTWGRWQGRRALRFQFEQGYNAGQVDRNEAIEARMRNGWRLVMNPRTEQPVWRGHYEGLAWPHDVGEGADTDTITAVMPGGLPSQESYRRQLAAIGADDEQATVMTMPAPYHPRSGPPAWAPKHAAPAAEAEPPCACGDPGHPGTEHGPTSCSTRHRCQPAERTGLAAELERTWLAVITITAGQSLAARYAPTPAELEGLADGVSYAAPPELALAADPAAELEAEIDDYLANMANGDVWRLRAESSHRAFCNANGLPWRPIDWEG